VIKNIRHVEGLIVINISKILQSRYFSSNISKAFRNIRV